MDKATGLHISASSTQGQSSSHACDTTSAVAIIDYCGGRNNHTGFALVRTANKVMLCYDARLTSISNAMACASGPIALSS